MFATMFQTTLSKDDQYICLRKITNAKLYKSTIKIRPEPIATHLLMADANILPMMCFDINTDEYTRTGFELVKEISSLEESELLSTVFVSR